MRINHLSLMIIIAMGLLFSFSSCEPSTDVGLEKSLNSVKSATPIPEGQNQVMELKHGDNQDSFFTVQLDDGTVRDGWCIEWNEPAGFGTQSGVKLYSTKGHAQWEELNYFMSIKNELRANDPALTYREIQVVIWSLIDNPSFDVDKISEYEK